MICNTCKAAGTILRTAPEVAEQLHKLCKGGCDCQHDTTGSALNMVLLTSRESAGTL